MDVCPYSTALGGPLSGRHWATAILQWRTRRAPVSVGHVAEHGWRAASPALGAYVWSCPDRPVPALAAGAGRKLERTAEALAGRARHAGIEAGSEFVIHGEMGVHDQAPFLSNSKAPLLSCLTRPSVETAQLRPSERLSFRVTPSIDDRNSSPPVERKSKAEPP